MDNGAQAAAAAVTDMESQSKPVNRFKLSSGIVLEFRHVPPAAVRRAMSMVEEPKVPTTFIPEKDREEENPNDPSYLRAMQEWVADVSDAAQKVAFILGVIPVDIPEGMYAVDDGEWIEELEAAGVPVPHETAAERRLSWLLYYAIISEDDLYLTTRMSLQKMGVTDAEVTAAIESFRGNAPLTPDPVLAAAAGSSDGDQLPDADSGGST
ncbi:hypothetical protein LCGC14_1382240 [marine sediment metagenome]|uniref:Tail assembly chaperone n=1 Tax=marine sediment metagenome TaxID=412755 RepID=A0A0F9N400_9ZZZZ